MPVQHKDTCVPSSNPLQCAYYNKDHKIVNMLGYELIEEKEVLAGSTQAVFTGLNGDEDEEYFIEIVLTQLMAADEQFLFAKPNSASSGLYGSFHRGGSSHDIRQGSSWYLSYLGLSGATVYHNIQMYLSSKSGKLRFGRGTSQSVTSELNSVINGSFSVLWTNLVDNITSLTVYVPGGLS